MQKKQFNKLNCYTLEQTRGLYCGKASYHRSLLLNGDLTGSPSTSLARDHGQRVQGLSITSVLVYNSTSICSLSNILPWLAYLRFVFIKYFSILFSSIDVWQSILIVCFLMSHMNRSFTNVRLCPPALLASIISNSSIFIELLKFMHIYIYTNWRGHHVFFAMLIL